jgi:glucosylceramidase
MNFHLISYRTLLFLLMCLLLTTASCRGKDNPVDKDTDPDPAGPSASVWLTRGDKTALLSPQGTLRIITAGNSVWPVIKIDSTVRFQSVDGYGAALTGSSAWLLHKKMNSADRQKLLVSLFDPINGIGISYLRLTMGASDFSLSDFTYSDLPQGETDEELNGFSLSRDLEEVVPVLSEILAVNNELEIMGSPWSAPAWMKTNGSLKGGKLKPEHYDVYAQYFVKYVEAMQSQGVTINAVTPQNEPLYFTAGYPCMEMQPQEQLEFIKNHLGPAFEQAGISTKIIVYDHNWDNTDYAISILNDPMARHYIAGSAFHAYGGNVSAMTTVRNAHPDKGLYFTEISGGQWAVDFAANLMWYMSNIFIGTAQNWSKSALMWNLVLDQNHGPRNNGCQDCRGVVTLNTVTGEVTFNEEYYAIGHFSKFIRPGAERISLMQPQALPDLGAVCFENTDGSKVLVVANYGNDMRTFSVQQGNKQFSYSITAKSVATIQWN